MAKAYAVPKNRSVLASQAYTREKYHDEESDKSEYCFDGP